MIFSFAPIPIFIHLHSGIVLKKKKKWIKFPHLKITTQESFEPSQLKTLWLADLLSPLPFSSHLETGKEFYQAGSKGNLNSADFTTLQIICWEQRK